MQVNKFMTMAVGLIVGVLLIAGVVTPVIANVSSEGGGSSRSYTIPGVNRVSITDANTNASFYYVSDTEYSLQPDTVTDRAVYDIGEDGILFCYTDDPSMRECRYLNGDNIYSISVVGDTCTDYDINGEPTDFRSGLWYFYNPTGDFVETVTYTDDTPHFETPYAFSDTPFVMYIDVSEGNDYVIFIISGTPENNTIQCVDPSFASEHTFSESATFTLENDIMTSMTFSIDGSAYPVPLLSGTSESDGVTVDDRTFWVWSFILPVNVVGEGESGGAGMPSTLTAILSVIPLVMTVGLVLGAVGYMRMKN